MNKYLRISITAAIGAGLGYAYYYFFGCSTGTCPITSNWHVSVLYGAFAGIVLGWPRKTRGCCGVSKPDDGNKCDCHK